MVTIKMKPASEIIRQLGLQKNGPAENFLANELLRVSEPYVPFNTGKLAKSGHVSGNKVIYDAPYARKLWNAKNAKGRRGGKWALRAWADNKDAVLRDLQRFIGGNHGAY